MFMKQETKNENKFGISLMRRNFIFGTSKANFRTPLVSHIFMWFVFKINDIDFASYADDKTPFFAGNDLD